MKIRLILASLVCTAAVINGVIAQPAAEKKEKTPLQTDMGAMDTAQKAMNRAINAGNAAEAAKQATALRQAAEAAAKLTSPKEVPAADKAKLDADFKAKMNGLVAEAKKLEAALAAGKLDEAKAINETMGKMKGEGHKEFKQPKK